MSEEQTIRMRERAHQLWESQGRPTGREVEHWQQAEREIGNASMDLPNAAIDSNGDDSIQKTDAGNLAAAGALGGPERGSDRGELNKALKSASKKP